MTSIRWPGSPTCSPASPSIPRNGSTNCCHGIGAPVIAKPIRQLEPKLTGTRPSPDAYLEAAPSRQSKCWLHHRNVLKLHELQPLASPRGNKAAPPRVAAL